MLYKNVSNSSISGVIKDVDTKTGTITGYFSIFGNIDSDKEVIVPGAFKRTLNNNYKRQKHLADHTPLLKNVLSGTRKGNLVIQEDGAGLYFESKITETSLGKDIILLYESGAIDEHSIGYEVVEKQKKAGYDELLELKLWEGSTVTWGANELATSKNLKAMSPEQLQKKQEVFMKALRSGTFENEEIFDIIELHLKNLEQHIIDLSTSSTQPAVVTAPDPQTGVKSDDFQEEEIKALLFLNQSQLKKQVNSYENQLQRMALS